MLRWCRRHPLPAHLILFAFVAIIAALCWCSGEWFFSGSRVTFGPLNSYVFIWVSIFVASAAALNSLLASSIASEVQRPFLNISKIYVQWSRTDGQPSTINYFVVDVLNAGVFPADNVSVDFNIWRENIDKKKYPLIIKRSTTSVYFPSLDNITLFFEEPVEEEKIVVDSGGKLQVKTVLSYRNKLTNRTHKTVREYKVQHTNNDLTPIPERDYWD